MCINNILITLYNIYTKAILDRYKIHLYSITAWNSSLMSVELFWAYCIFVHWHDICRVTHEIKNIDPSRTNIIPQCQYMYKKDAYMFNKYLLFEWPNNSMYIIYRDYSWKAIKQWNFSKSIVQFNAKNRKAINQKT